MDKIIKILEEIENSKSGVYRKFMSTEEIELCNKLVKDDMLYKGKPDEKNATIAFYITPKGIEWLDKLKHIEYHYRIRLS
jgi:predicted transcriptional regulator